MDELEMTRRLRAAGSSPDQASIANARAGLLQLVEREKDTVKVRTPRPHRRRDWLWLTAGASAAAFAAIAAFVLNVDPSTTPPQADRLPVVSISGLAKYGSSTASDVVTWSDQVVVAVPITSTSPGTLPDDPFVNGAGEAPRRFINRVATFRVDKVLWRRLGARALPDTFDMEVPGWLMDDEGGLAKLSMDGSTWFEEGEAYVVPVAFDQGRWVTLAPAAFPFRDGVASPAASQRGELAGTVSGKSADQLINIFTRAHPNPEVVPFLGLDRSERYEAWQNAAPQG